MSASDDLAARRRTLDGQLWEWEAKVSAQLGRLEASYERDGVAAPMQVRMLALDMQELARCLRLRADFIAMADKACP